MKIDKTDTSEERELRASGALPQGYTPTTETGWRLVQLRAKSVRNGHRFLSEQEVQAKISSLRD